MRASIRYPRRVSRAAAAALLLAVAAPAAAAPAAAAPPPPSLTLVRTAPLTVRGSGFAPLERVRLTAPATGASVRASSSGAFTAALPGARVSRCSALVVRAVGAGGSTALLKLPRPACMDAKSPAKSRGATP
jgi:hypothetical protein